MQKINRIELEASQVAGGASKGSNQATATASGSSTATATINVNVPATQDGGLPTT